MKAFPYGKVEVKVVGGGLRWHSGIVAPKLGEGTVGLPLTAQASSSAAIPACLLVMLMLWHCCGRSDQCNFCRTVQQCCVLPATIVSSMVPAQNAHRSAWTVCQCSSCSIALRLLLPCRRPIPKGEDRGRVQ